MTLFERLYIQLHADKYSVEEVDAKRVILSKIFDLPACVFVCVRHVCCKIGIQVLGEYSVTSHISSAQCIV
jgi:hypothetical protein